MNRKQKLSFLSAIVMPLIAFAAFSIFTPARASAYSSCGTCGEAAPCGNGGCQSGAGGCWANGSSNGIYVFCDNSDGRIGGGPGQCTNGCVYCRYGPCY